MRSARIDGAVTDDGVDVISMSLGSSSYSQGLELACIAAVSDGVVVVAAAGNSGNTATGSARATITITNVVLEGYTYDSTYPLTASINN